VEGLHFGAGPWFTVLEIGAGWQRIGKAWLSDGSQDDMAVVEAKLTLTEPNEKEPTAAAR
jgi:hypothetical protein